MHPLAAPGPLWVLSRVGKYLVRPQADETSHKKQVSCGRQGKALSCFFLFLRRFRLCGGDQRAFRSPFGNLRALAAKGWRKKTDFLWMARERPSLLLPVLQRVSPLRRRPKGFPLALWKPSGPYWLKRLRARKLNLSSSSFQQSDAVSGSYARLSSPGTRGVIAPVCTSASRCSGLVSNT